MSKKRGVLGLSFPLLTVMVVVVIGLFVIGFISGPLGSKLLGRFGVSITLPEWIVVHRPEVSLPAETVFHLFGFPITNTVVSAWVTIIFLVAVSYAITHRIKLVPGRVQAAFEFLLGWLYDFCQRVAGEKNGRRFFPVVATIFLFVAFNAWLSLLPGYGSITFINEEGEHIHLLRGANTDINFPLALALVSFCFVEFNGLKTLGIRYLGKFVNVGMLFHSIGLLFTGKVGRGFGGIFTGLINVFTGVINLFVGVIETLTEFIRIISLTFRLFGNMTAGEILLLVVAFLAPWVTSLPFYGLELLIGLVQALIFGGLTLVFATMAVASHGGEH